MTAKNLIKILEANGWFWVRTKGSHHIYNHPVRTNAVIVPVHKGDIPTGTYHAILKSAGLK